LGSNCLRFLALATRATIRPPLEGRLMKENPNVGLKSRACRRDWERLPTLITAFYCSSQRSVDRSRIFILPLGLGDCRDQHHRLMFYGELEADSRNQAESPVKEHGWRKQVAVPAATRTPTWHRAEQIAHPECGWKDGVSDATERKKAGPVETQKNPLDSNRPSHGERFHSATPELAVVARALPAAGFGRPWLNSPIFLRQDNLPASKLESSGTSYRA